MTDDTEHPDGTDGPHGTPPFADDARRLLTAVQEWAQRAMPEPPSGHPGPECQWCPLCQFASILRGEHPEVAERVAEAGTALARALRVFVDATVARTTGANGTGGVPGGVPGGAAARTADEGGGPTRPRPERPRVQHIELGGPPADDE